MILQKDIKQAKKQKQKSPLMHTDSGSCEILNLLKNPT